MRNLPKEVKTPTISLTQLSELSLKKFSQFAANIEPDRNDWSKENINYWFLADYPKSPQIYIFETGFVTVSFPRDDFAEIGIGVESINRQQGWGSMAVHAMCEMLFNKVRKIIANIQPENTASIKLFTKLGFVHEGTLRQEVLHKNAYIDLCRYSCFAHELKSLVPPKL